MSSTLRKLANDPLPDLASRSFLQFKNYVVPGVMTAADLERKLLASVSSTITSSDASETIRRAFEAAKGSRS
jgi:hypothetical protein